MAITTTLLDYRTRFYDRFDEGQSNYISNAEANRYINEARAHLHNWIVVSDENYMVNEYVWPTVANQSDYVLPADFFKDLKLFGYKTTTGNLQPYYWALPRRMRQEFHGGSATIFRYPSDNVPFGYMILGNIIRLDPVPSDSSIGLKMWYAPHYIPLVNDSDTENSAFVPGWDEYVVNQAVISAKIKEESAIQDILARQGEIKQLIEQDMINRDMGQPGHVVDVSRYGYSGIPGDYWRGQ